MEVPHSIFLLIEKKTDVRAIDFQELNGVFDLRFIYYPERGHRTVLTGME